MQDLRRSSVWINKISEELKKFQDENPDKKVAPFAVNQICHHSNDRLEHDVDICVKHSTFNYY